MSWSGPLDQAREVAKRLCEDAPFEHGAAVLDSIEGALVGYTPSLSVFVTTNSFFASFGPSTRCRKHGANIWLAGSGTKHFQEAFNISKENNPAEVGEIQIQYMECIKSLVRAAAIALIEEAMTMGTLKEHYGGGFELIAREYVLGKVVLQKKPLTLMFWRSRLRGKHVMLGLSLIIQQFYFGEDLYYLATHLNSEHLPAGAKARHGGLCVPYENKAGLVHKLIKVEPIIRIIPAAPKPTFGDITSERIYTHIVFENEDDSAVSENVACLTNGPETPNYFEIENMQRGMDIRFSSQFTEDVKSSINYHGGK